MEIWKEPVRTEIQSNRFVNEHGGAGRNQTKDRFNEFINLDFKGICFNLYSIISSLWAKFSYDRIKSYIKDVTSYKVKLTSYENNCELARQFSRWHSQISEVSYDTKIYLL